MSCFLNLMISISKLVKNHSSIIHVLNLYKIAQGNRNESIYSMASWLVLVLVYR